jgi:hypothetical protein
MRYSEPLNGDNACEGDLDFHTLYSQVIILWYESHWVLNAILLYINGHAVVLQYILVTPVY